MTSITNTNPPVRTAPSTHDHHRRAVRRMPAALAFITASVAALSACGSSNPTAESSAVTASTAAEATSAITAPTTTEAPAEPFRSAFYGYSVTSIDWTGRSATVEWDGAGSPGSLDPTVDALMGPHGRPVYAIAAPAAAGLDDYAAAARAAAHASTDHPCPAGPEATQPTTISGEPAIVDEIHCPDPAGVFVLGAYVIHAGRAYTFFTFDQPGKEAEMRTSFGALLQAITFDS